jgi:hypothetical protein
MYGLCAVLVPVSLGGIVVWSGTYWGYATSLVCTTGTTFTDVKASCAKGFDGEGALSVPGWPL